LPEISAFVSISGVEEEGQMTHIPQQNISHDRAEQWITTAASILVGTCFFALWFWLLPGWLGFRVETAGALALAGRRPVGDRLLHCLRCIWDFGWTGRGTPAPVLPPQRLVVVGFYQYVRNPMYVGFAAGWIGLWIVFGHASVLAIVVVAAVALGVDLFVMFYEEPTLRKKFGAVYEEYCRHVRRWLPRWHAWQQTKRLA
jgi:protein-S-isoprenylcysteine O-methyltransferase Ste14